MEEVSTLTQLQQALAGFWGLNALITTREMLIFGTPDSLVSRARAYGAHNSRRANGIGLACDGAIHIVSSVSLHF